MAGRSLERRLEVIREGAIERKAPQVVTGV